MVAARTVETRSVLAFTLRAQVEQAWRDLLEVGQAPPAELVVTRAGELTTCILGSEVVYVPDPGGDLRTEVLGHTAVAMLPLRDLRLGDQVVERHGPLGLVPSSSVEARVRVDDAWADEASSLPLLDVLPAWLRPLTLAVVQSKHRGTPPLNEQLLRQVSQRLEQARLVQGRRVTTVLAGSPVPRAQPGSLCVSTESGPRVVVLQPPNGTPLVTSSAGDLAELIGLPSLADNLRLASLLMRERRPEGHFDSSDLEAVFEARPGSLTDLAQLEAGRLSDWSAVVTVLATVDPDAAERLRAASEASAGQHDLREQLALLAEDSGGSWTSDRVLAASEQSDLYDAMLLLEGRLATANAGLRRLGLSTMRNESGIHRDFESLLAARRPAIETELRDRFAGTVTLQTDDAALAAYARLRDLETLEVDVAWFDEHWTLPRAAFDHQVGQWLDRVAPPLAGTERPPPLEDLRETGRRVIVSVLQNARILIEAWSNKHAVTPPDLPADSGEVIERMTVQGRLDFRRLSASDVTAWLAAGGHWPSSMPVTTSREQLELEPEELAAARDRLARARVRKEQSGRTVKFAGRAYSDDLDDHRALAAAIQAAAAGMDLEQALSPILLSEAPASDDDGARNKPRTGRAGRAAGVPSGLASSIGRAGEVLVAEWVRRATGLSREQTWRSGYRSDVIGDGQGSDGYGYDFEVPLDNGRVLLLEVKSSTELCTEFQLTETEVRRAQALAAHEDYMIVAVSHVLEPTRCEITPLPNPFAPEGFSHYNVVGRALRLRWTASTPAG